MNAIIKKAIIETYKRYGKEQAKHALKSLMRDRDISYFTNSNNARHELEEELENEYVDIKYEVLINYISQILKAKGQVERAISPAPKQKALEDAIKQTYNKYNDFEIVYKCLKDYFEEGENHFTRANFARENLEDAFETHDIEILQNELLEIICNTTVQEIEKEDRYNSRAINNVNINSKNMNAIQEKMITGLTHDKEGSVLLANMQATTNIGKVRKNQEDALLLKTHPINSKLKILLVADGMGGGIDGEEASHKVVAEISKWFEKMPETNIMDIETLKYEFDREINRISREIYDKYKGKAGSTLVCGIVSGDETLIANVGDSRAYILKDGNLEQVTKDHSYVQELFEEGRIERKDDMRFHVDSNMINQAIGARAELYPSFIRIKNTEYDKLLLFSDGVTDCLSDNDILAITRLTPKDRLAEILVKSALNNESRLRSELKNDTDYYEKIKGGKDNTTAAVLNNDEDERT